MKKASWRVMDENLTLDANVQQVTQPPYVEQEWRLVVAPAARPPMELFKVSREDIIRVRNFLNAILADSED